MTNVDRHLRRTGVAPDELRARLQVFVVYYDLGSRTHIPLPDEEPNTFLHFLWEAASGYLGDGDDRTGPLGRAVSTSQLLDYERADTNARRFISRVERVELRNYPLTDEQWEGMHDFYYERGGAWKDEDLLSRPSTRSGSPTASGWSR
ncbi:hypothetical protein AB0D24_34825 [Streptomyces javensis]|uniref:hypothetical protein n=1 Tax=Streptomyces javensis TaxID=114698 RepID=UPI0033C13DE5